MSSTKSRARSNKINVKADRLALKKTTTHPHLYLLVTERGKDFEGTFPNLAEFQDSLLAEFFKREVFSLGKSSSLRPWWRRSQPGAIFSVVDRIINHLKLTFVAAKPPPPQIAYQELLMAAETGIKYFL